MLFDVLSLCHIFCIEDEFSVGTLLGMEDEYQVVSLDLYTDGVLRFYSRTLYTKFPVHR